LTSVSETLVGVAPSTAEASVSVVVETFLTLTVELAMSVTVAAPTSW
jgi:hypothetical protein